LQVHHIFPMVHLYNLKRKNLNLKIA
jgi:hypothetical protein